MFLLQRLLGAEATSLQWRLIASNLITRLSRDPQGDKSDGASASGTSNAVILAQLFTVLGYFSVNDADNQVRLG